MGGAPVASAFHPDFSEQFFSLQRRGEAAFGSDSRCHLSLRQAAVSAGTIRDYCPLGTAKAAERRQFWAKVLQGTGSCL